MGHGAFGPSIPLKLGLGENKDGTNIFFQKLRLVWRCINCVKSHSQNIYVCLACLVISCQVLTINERPKPHHFKFVEMKVFYQGGQGLARNSVSADAQAEQMSGKRRPQIGNGGIAGDALSKETREPITSQAGNERANNREASGNESKKIGIELQGTIIQFWTGLL